jgi:aminocarboxymuconate-semialdehyde decarboxylase
MSVHVVDVHSHIYPELYLRYLGARTTAPFVRDSGGQRSFVIFPGESGRPMDASYWDIGEKLGYMDRSGIARTVLSLGNPWLDPISGTESVPLARELNDYFAALDKETNGRIVGLGCLPSSNVADAVEVAGEIAQNRALRGVVVGTRICGLRLDDPALEPLWWSLNQSRLAVLVHPHYGLGLEEMDGFGHVLPLALSFTFETTTALARLVLAGIPERMPDLRILGSHGGGTLPFLAGRLDGCWHPDQVARGISSTLPSQVIGRLFLDAVVYSGPSLVASADAVGTDHMAFGTDHPFSIADAAQNLRAIRDTFRDSAAEDVLWRTAERLFALPDKA